MRLLLRHDRLWRKQEPESVDPVPSIPLSEAPLLRESTIEPPPSIRRPRHSQEGPERTPIGTWTFFRRQQGNVYASPFLLEPGLLDRTMRQTVSSRTIMILRAGPCPLGALSQIKNCAIPRAFYGLTRNLSTRSAEQLVVSRSTLTTRPSAANAPHLRGRSQAPC